MYSCCDFIVFYRIIWILEVVWMKYKILVVDDDKELVKMLCSYFNMKQYETITATDGMEALNKIKNETGYYFVGYQYATHGWD